MEKLSLKEKVVGQPSYRYTILRPGGNDTALVKSPILSPSQRVEISSQLMKFYPDVEQVGFINLEGSGPRLTMAGGEFCGNATRSTAYLACGGKPGEVNMSVTGVQKMLRAGVNEDGEAFAQMPIYEDPKKIQEIGQNGDSWLVEMEGITHFVTFDTLEIDNLGRAEIKQMAEAKINELGLEVYPAAGVIYAKKTDEGFEIKPVVWVKGTNDLFYETACGSGTTALGLVLTKIKGEGIEVPVIQPSGLPIKIQVELAGDEFQNAQICGPIQILSQGALEQTGKGNFVIEKISNKKQLEDAFSQGLINLYQEIFSRPPYQELFSEEEIIDLFNNYLQNGLLFLARSTDKVIGFGAALSLNQVPEIKEIADKGGLDPNQTWYMADLGVDENFRRVGLGGKLIGARINSFPKGSTVLMRTSKKNKDSQNLYSDLGFSIIPNMVQKVQQVRIDGQIKTDRRIFMARKI